MAASLDPFYGPSDPYDVPDLTQLEYLDERSLLLALQTRYQHGKIYVRFITWNVHYWSNYHHYYHKVCVFFSQLIRFFYISDVYWWCSSRSQSIQETTFVRRKGICLEMQFLILYNNLNRSVIRNFNSLYLPQIIIIIDCLNRFRCESKNKLFIYFDKEKRILSIT